VTEHTVTICPHCLARLDASTPAFDPGSVPKEGDVSVCVYCATVLVFRADQTLRPMTRIESYKLTHDEMEGLRRAKCIAVASPVFGRPPR
jgi:hypothetical protein